MFVIHSSRPLPTAQAMEQTKQDAKQGCVVDEASDLPSAVEGTYQGATLILCNAGASSVLEPDSDFKAQDQKTLPSFQTQKPPPPQGLHFDAASLLFIDSNRLTSQGHGHGVTNGSPVADACVCDPEMSTKAGKEEVCLSML